MSEHPETPETPEDSSTAPGADPQPDPGLDPGLDPRVEDAVRRALADARHDDPVPAQVARRLDDTLAELRAEREAEREAEPAPALLESDPEAVVIALDPAARARRLRVRLLLGAAAVVVAGGVVAGVFDDDTGQDASIASSLAEDAPARDQAPAPGAEQAPEAPGSAAALSERAAGGAALDSAPSAGTPSPQGPAPFPVQRIDTGRPVSEIRPDRLREDLVALQLVSITDPRDVDYSGTRLYAPDDFVCAPAVLGAGLLVGVDYAGRPAVVAFRAPVGTTQEADVLACGTGDVLHSITLTTAG